MRPTFLIDATSHLVSAVACKSLPHALRTGDVVTLSKPFATEYGAIPEGCAGIVTDVDEAEGIVEITMEGQLPALYLWGNRLILVPFETEDLTQALVCQKAPRRRPRAFLRYAAAACLSFTAGWLLETPDRMFHLHTHRAAAMGAPCISIADMPSPRLKE